MTTKSKEERLWEWLKKQDYGLVDTRKIYDYVTKYYKMRKSARYYKENPEAAAKKRKYQKEYNKKPSQVKKRVELARENRRRGTYGNGDNLDISHTKKGTMVLEKLSKNRARNRSKK